MEETDDKGKEGEIANRQSGQVLRRGDLAVDSTSFFPFVSFHLQVTDIGYRQSSRLGLPC
jgi:hypothetical protein